jgi:tRNA (cmo5U34)-methyltransferase
MDGLEVMLELLPPGVERVLDLGTGDGITLALVLSKYPDATGIGLDFGEEMLRHAAARFAAESRVELARYDMSKPMPEVGTFDAIVSSFAIHHLDPPRQQALYGEVFERLRPGGVFVNAEHVDSPTQQLHHEFLAALGKEPDDDDPSNQLVALERHLTWLNGCGFEHVDCFWKWRELAVVSGIRPV